MNGSETMAESGRTSSLTADRSLPPKAENESRSIDEVLARIRRLTGAANDTEAVAASKSNMPGGSSASSGASSSALDQVANSKEPSATPAAVPSVPAIPPAPVSQPKPTFSFPNDGKFKLLSATEDPNEPMIPLEPESLEDAGLSATLVEELVLKFLYARGEAEGRVVADQSRLPFGLVTPILTRLKSQQLVVYSSATSMNDYIYTLTETGRDRARRAMQKTTYFGAAPVRLEDYVRSVKMQSVEMQHPTQEQLRKAFSDLLITDEMLKKVGPAVNSGRGMFLFGYPGNGKTSIAERITRSFGEFIWIPRAVLVEGEVMRVFDPLVHHPEEGDSAEGLLRQTHYDHRWIRIRRPTVIVGGELTMEMLEVQRNSETNIAEAPLQIKSNCGVLLIDDFGRQRISVAELLNRWIVPLEKRYDFLTVAGGKKTQVPFDQLVIFSTNLEPKDLVDDAFLRRIPYKIEVPNPSEEAFRKLFGIMCKVLKIPHDPDVVDYLIETHYRPVNRPFRNCHPRDLLLQVRSYCFFNELPLEMKREFMDFAVDNYFSMM